MRSFVSKVLLFLLVTILTVTLALWFTPYPKNYGYHTVRGHDFKKVAWDYNRIFSSDEPIDIAFIGTSQSYYGIQDILIENQLRGHGMEKNVVNLAFPGLGRNQHYVIADDLLSHKSPKTLIIEVMEREKRDSHQAAVYIASNGQAANFLRPTNIKSPRDILSFFSSRRQHLRDLLRHKSSFNDPTISISDPSFVTIDRSFSLQEMEIKRKDLEARRAPVLLPEKYWGIEYDFPISMLKKICSEARDRDIQILFLYVAHYGAPEHPDPFFLEIYRQQGEVMLPPPEIWNNPSYFCDSHHLNKDGSDRLSKWISVELKNRLDPQPTSPRTSN